MRKFTKLLFALALTIVGLGEVNAINADAISTRIYATDYSSMGTTLPDWWHQENTTVTVADGILTIVNETDQGQYNDWKAQAHVAVGIPTVVGKDYVVRIKLKGDKEGSLNCLLGDWGGSVTQVINVTTEWQTLDIVYSGALHANSFLMFHLGHYQGTINIEKAEVYDYVRLPQLIHETDYSSMGTTIPDWWHKENCTVTVADGILTIVNETDQGQYNDWKAQSYVTTGISTKVGKDYVARINLKGDVEGSLNCLLGSWGSSVTQVVNVPTDWQEISLTYDNALHDNSFLMFHLGHYQGTINIKKAEIFELVAARNISVGANGYATFSTDKPINVDGIVTAYSAKYNGTYLVLTPVTEIPAGAGVIIEASADTYTVPVIESASALDNDLQVSDGNVEGDGTIYVLAKKNDKVGFYKLENGEKVPAGKAYLTITGSSAPDFLGFDGGTTSINELNVKGQADGAYYNLAGQRVAQPTKGLYIVNGKKYIVK